MESVNSAKISAAPGPQSMLERLCRAYHSPVRGLLQGLGGQGSAGAVAGSTLLSFNTPEGWPDPEVGSGSQDSAPGGWEYLCSPTRGAGGINRRKPPAEKPSP